MNHRILCNPETKRCFVSGGSLRNMRYSEDEPCNDSLNTTRMENGKRIKKLNNYCDDSSHKLVCNPQSDSFAPRHMWWNVYIVYTLP